MNILKTLLKIVVTCLGLYLALSSSDLSEVDLSFNLQQVLLFFLILILNAINVLLLGVRLKQFVPALPLLTAIKINLIGLFFNLFLPTVIGSDIVRMYELNKYTKTTKSSVGIVLLDRVIGLTALTMLTIFFVFLSYFYEAKGLEMILVYLTIGISFVICCFWLFFIGVKITDGKLIEFFNKYLPKKFSDQITLLSDTLTEISRPQIFRAFGLSLVIQFIVGLQFYIVIAHIYMMDISLIVSSIISSITNLILVLPISIGGLGVRDYLYILFVPDIVSNPELVLVGPTIYLMIFLTGAFGGVIYLLNGKSKTVEIDESTGSV